MIKLNSFFSLSHSRFPYFLSLFLSSSPLPLTSCFLLFFPLSWAFHSQATCKSQVNHSKLLMKWDKGREQDCNCRVVENRLWKTNVNESIKCLLQSLKVVLFNDTRVKWLDLNSKVCLLCFFQSILTFMFSLKNWALDRSRSSVELITPSQWTLPMKRIRRFR